MAYHIHRRCLFRCRLLLAQKRRTEIDTGDAATLCELTNHFMKVLRWKHAPRALEWDAMTGPLVCAKTSRIPASFKCDKSITMPSRSISSTKAIPVGVSPFSRSGRYGFPSSCAGFGNPSSFGKFQVSVEIRTPRSYSVCSFSILLRKHHPLRRSSPHLFFLPSVPASDPHTF